MKGAIKSGFSLVKEAAKGWAAVRAPRMGAALAFYMMFSLAPLMILVVTLSGLFLGEQTVRSEVFAQISSLVGEEAGEMARQVMEKARRPSEGIWSSLIAGAVLLLGASAVFVQLQEALNAIWNVKQKPRKGWWRFLRKRFLSFAMILVIGFLLLVSLALSAALAALGKYLVTQFAVLEPLWHGIDLTVSFLLVSLLFAMLFKVLPDVSLKFRDVWVGAMVTSLLFVGGKFLLGYYLGKSAVVSGYGAAGGLVLILLWVYYSAQILFFGAEFTQVYARRRGGDIEPEAHAEPNPAPA